MTADRKARTRLDPVVRRQQIAAAAARVFADRDPSEVSFEAVAEEAGVSRSLVYAYFRDRGSLFAAAYNHELARLEGQIDGALASMASDRDRLARAVGSYLRFAWRHHREWALIASANGSRHPAVREAVGARVERIAETLGGTAEARLLVRAVLGMLEAAAAQTLDRDEVEQVALAELLTQVIWGGVSSIAPPAARARSEAEVDLPEP